MTPRRGSAPPYRVAHPLDEDERQGIVLAVNSAFRKLKNLYEKIVPFFNDYGFKRWFEAGCQETVIQASRGNAAGGKTPTSQNGQVVYSRESSIFFRRSVGVKIDHYPPAYS